MAVYESDCGRMAVRELGGDAQAEMRSSHTQLVLAHLVEDTRAVAKDGGDAGGRVPDHVAETAQSGEVRIDFIPIGMECDVFGGSDGEEPLRRSSNDAGVGDVELESCAGCERRSERDGGLMQLTGVIDIGVERGDGEGNVAAVDANALPIEGRGDLQRDAGERGVAVVADGNCCANGNLMLGRVEMHIQIEAGEADGLPLSVGCGGRGDGLTAKLWGCGTGGCRGLAVVVSGAGEADGAVRGLGLLWGWSGLGSGLGEAGSGAAKKHAANDATKKGNAVLPRSQKQDLRLPPDDEVYP